MSHFEKLILSNNSIKRSAPCVCVTHQSDDQQHARRAPTIGAPRPVSRPFPGARAAPEGLAQLQAAPAVHGQELPRRAVSAEELAP